MLMKCTVDSQSDMNHSNMYAVGLALCTFANIASEEMSRDLANEIEKLLGSSNTYIRKKVRLDVLATVLRCLYPHQGRPLRPSGSKESTRSQRPFHRESQKPSYGQEPRSPSDVDHPCYRDVSNRARHTR